MRKIIIVLLSVLSVAAIGLYFYAYQSHRDISTEDAAYSLTLSELQIDFRTSDSLFNAKYADKTIEIYGKITAIDVKNFSFMIDDKIAVTFQDSTQPRIKVLDSAYVKGRYVGYDDLLEEFKIDQAIIVEK
jgi:hypothetical protein